MQNIKNVWLVFVYEEPLGLLELLISLAKFSHEQFLRQKRDLGSTTNIILDKHVFFFIIFIFSVKIPLRWLRQRLAKPKKKPNPLIRRKGIRVTLRENALPNMITRRQPRFQVQGDVIFLSLPSQYHHLLLYHHSSLYSIPSKKFQIKFHKKTTMWWYVINLS